MLSIVLHGIIAVVIYTKLPSIIKNNSNYKNVCMFVAQFKIGALNISDTNQDFKNRNYFQQLR